MRKAEFLAELKKELLFLPKSEINSILTEYADLIDGYIADGLTESEAVAKCGDIYEISAKYNDEQAIIEPEHNKLDRKSAIKEMILDVFVILVTIFGGLIALCSGLVGVLGVIFSFILFAYATPSVVFFYMFMAIFACGFCVLLAPIIIKSSTTKIKHLIDCIKIWDADRGTRYD